MGGGQPCHHQALCWQPQAPGQQGATAALEQLDWTTRSSFAEPLIDELKETIHIAVGSGDPWSHPHVLPRNLNHTESPVSLLLGGSFFTASVVSHPNLCRITLSLQLHTITFDLKDCLSVTTRRSSLCWLKDGVGGMAQDAVARKKRSAEEGVLLELTPHFLEQTELKRWPDYHFLIGQREPGVIARKQGICQSGGSDVTLFWC